MSEILSSFLAIQIYIVAIVVIVASCSLHLESVSGTTLFQCIEDVETVVLIEFKLLTNFLGAILVAILIMILQVIVLLGRRFLEEIGIQVFIHQDALIQGLFRLLHWSRLLLREELAVKCIDFRHKILNSLRSAALIV